MKGGNFCEHRIIGINRNRNRLCNINPVTVSQKEMLTVDTSNLYPSKYVGSDDLGGSDVTVTIKELKLELLKDRSGQQQAKPVLYFSNAKKGLVVNKTNLKQLQSILGSKNSRDWTGKRIVLYSMPVSFGDQVTQGIRIKSESNGNGAAQAASPAIDPDDNVPDSFEPDDEPPDGFLDDVPDEKLPF